MMKKLLIVLLTLTSSAFAQVAGKFSTVDAKTGYTVNGAAPANQVMCGNGTVFVPAVSCGVVQVPFYQLVTNNGGAALPQRGITNFTSDFNVTDSTPSTTVGLANTIHSNIAGNSATSTLAATATNANAVGGVSLAGLCQSNGAGCSGNIQCNSHGCFKAYADGVIEQWGQVSVPPTGTGTNNATIIFPTSFTQGGNVVTTFATVGAASNSSDPSDPPGAQLATQSLTGATIFMARFIQAGEGGGHFDNTLVVVWRAIGN